MAASAFGEGPRGFSLKPIRTASSAKPPSGKTGTEPMASAALSAASGFRRRVLRGRERCHIRGGRRRWRPPPRWPRRPSGTRGGSGRARRGSTRSRGVGRSGREGCVGHGDLPGAAGTWRGYGLPPGRRHREPAGDAMAERLGTPTSGRHALRDCAEHGAALTCAVVLSPCSTSDVPVSETGVAQGGWRYVSRGP